MRARRSSGPRWLRRLAVKVEPVLFSVRAPALFVRLHLLGWRDTESAERQDHGPYSDVGLGGFADIYVAKMGGVPATGPPLDSSWTPKRPPGGFVVCKSLSYLVGLPRFELGTSCTPSKKYQLLTDHVY